MENKTLLPDWVQAARELPVAFAQVREDPRLDVALLASLDQGAEVVMIASGGCTSAVLAHGRRAGSLTVVDGNPAQLQLARIKHGLLGVDPAERRLVCGHDATPASVRLAAIDAYCVELGVDPAQFCPDPNRRARGLDHVGRYECLFDRLSQVLRGAGLDPLTLGFVRGPGNLARLRDCFHRVMPLEVLVALFGAGACANRVQDFAGHFFEQAVKALEDGRAVQGPFADAVFRTDRVCSDRDWVRLPRRSDVTPLTEVEGDMLGHLRSRPTGSVDLVHLSNICDWLTVEDVSALLNEVGRVLRPRGIALLRQLNSTLDVTGLDSPLAWDGEASRKATLADRSFFYRHVWIGRA